MKVKVYSTPVCPYCIMVKDFLTEHNIKFEDIDVSKDRAAAKHMIEKSGQMGVPVVEIGDKIIIGFNKPKIIEALGINEE